MTPLTSATRSLWEQYRQTGDPTVRSQLLDQYLGLVRHIARQITVQIGGRVELDDLISAGTLGLVLTLESFDPERGLAFSTYATPRIRGAILDDLRTSDWVSRSVRSKHRKIHQAIHMLEAHLGRAPNAPEIANALGIPIDTYWRWQEDIEGGVQVSYETPAPHEASSTSGLDQVLADESLPDSAEILGREEDIAALRDAMAELTSKERAVLSLCYYEELTLRETAEILHLTESRISQIRSGALKRLRQLLNTRIEL